MPLCRPGSGLYGRGAAPGLRCRAERGVCRRAGAEGRREPGKEELGCTTSLVPAGAALPPPSLLLLLRLFIAFIFIALICLYSTE